MSRIGKKPITVPAGVKVELRDHRVKVSGPKGTLVWDHPAQIQVAYDSGGSVITVTRSGDSKRERSLHGLTRALVANMVQGVHAGYEKRMEIYGTGFGCKLQGRQLALNLGFMGRGEGGGSQFVVEVPTGLDVEIEVPNARGDNEPAKFVVRGADKQQVGEFAAEVRVLRKPEPYKGKGIRYAGEQIRRKQGKAFASGGGG